MLRSNKRKGDKHIEKIDKNFYNVYSKMKHYKRKIKEAENIVSYALSKSNKPLVSFSGGKDSIVMLDIICKAGFKGEIVFFKYGIRTDAETPKETLDIAEYYAKKHGLKINIIPCLGEFDCWEELGYFCIFPKTEEEVQVFNKTNSDYQKKVNEFEKEYGCDLSFLGLRKEESNQRKITLIKKGQLYNTKNRISTTCCPISNFTGNDIWTYIFSNNLRYPSFYDYPHQSRNFIRNEPCLLYNDSIYRHGAAETFKDIFPEYMAEIKKKYPNAQL